MKYVIGIDIGTSAVKTILVNQNGKVCAETSKLSAHSREGGI